MKETTKNKRRVIIEKDSNILEFYVNDSKEFNEFLESIKKNSKKKTEKS